MAILNAFQSSVTGVNGAVLALQKQNETMGKNLEKVLKKSGLNIQRASQLMVPVNFGILKSSAFTRSEGTGVKTVVSIGYTARYALYVHEAVDMKLKGKPRPNDNGTRIALSRAINERGESLRKFAFQAGMSEEEFVKRFGKRYGAMPKTDRPHNRGYFWDPQGQAQAKFLEEPFKRMAPQIRSDIAEALKP